MPVRTDIHKILIIGGGPIMIGQGCYADCAATSAAIVLRERGYEVVVVDSNPDAILTDPKVADATYIEPLTVTSIAKIIEKEEPDALLASVGGHTAQNLAMQMNSDGILARFRVEMIGIDERAISRLADKKLFKETLGRVGINTPKSGIANTIDEGLAIISDLGFPVVLRPTFTLAGVGSAIAYNKEEYMHMLSSALKTSPVHQTLIEQAMLGYKSVEFEVVRDCKGSALVIAGMEHIDPVDVHSGDSITVFPVQTLAQSTIDELHRLSLTIAEIFDVVGEMCIRYALNPQSGDVVVISAQAGTTRFPALAAKATGFPLSRVVPALAVGATLDEIPEAGAFKAGQNHCMVRLPRFDFAKFAGADDTLGASMKSVGDVVSFGGTFNEALQKGIRSLETGRWGLGSDGCDSQQARSDIDLIRQKLAQPNPGRLFYARYALEAGLSESEICSRSKIDQWFVSNIAELIQFEQKFVDQSLVSVSSATIHEAKKLGYSDEQLAFLLETTQDQVRQRRKVLGIKPAFRAVDGGQSFYSTYAETPSVPIAEQANRVLILAGGPNRVGQGSPFDYCCAHSSYAVHDAGLESVIINCNPQSITTSRDAADALFIEPLTTEDVLEVIDHVSPGGVIAQMGGRSALELGRAVEDAGVSILGACAADVDRALSFDSFNSLIEELQLNQTSRALVTDIQQALACAADIDYPLLVSSIERQKPTEIVYDVDDLREYCESVPQISCDNPVLMAHFLEDAVGVDVDVVCDGQRSLVCGVMQRIEQAGIHYGDSASSLPPYNLSEQIINEITRQSRMLALGLKIRGLVNIHFAIRDEQIYVLEVSPAASLTIPFVSKATGVDWVGIATRIAMGRTLDEQGITTEIVPSRVSVKETVFPFARFAGVDVVLGPEMKSTGSVMAVDVDFGHAYLKSEVGAGQILPKTGTVFISVAHPDKTEIGEVAMALSDMGFTIAATRGTAESIKKAGVSVKVVSKIGEGRPDAVDLVKNDEIALILNTPSGKRPRKHEVTIRSAVVACGIPIITTLAGARATIRGLEASIDNDKCVRSIQDYSQK